MNKKRKQNSLWGDFGEYLRGEMIVIFRLLGVILLIIFLIVSLFVGMYHVAIHLFFAIFFGKEIDL